MLQNKGSVDTAYQLILPALDEAVSLGNDTLIAFAYHILGVNYQYRGSSELAIQSYLKAIEINERLVVVDDLLKQLNNIGLVYREEGEYDKALDYLKRCLELSIKTGNRQTELYSYGNVGYIYMKQGLFEKAIERFERTLSLAAEIEDDYSVCTGHYLLSDVKFQQGEFKVSEFHANSAIELSKKISFPLGQVYGGRLLSEIYRENNKLFESKREIDKAIEIMNNTSTFVYYEDVMNAAYKLELKRNNFKKALEIQLNLSERRDSLNQIKIKERIANSEFKFQLLKNEQENQLLKLENDSSEMRAFYAYVIIFLIGLLAAALFYAYRKSKNDNDYLEASIQERTKDLIKSNKELERFTYITAHDLKEPSRNLVSFSTLLNKKLKAEDYSSLSDYASMISQNSKQLYNLIDKIMKFSSIQNEGKMTYDDVNLGSIIDQIKELISDTIKKENVNITHHNLPTIKGDSSLLLILFKNLIENAIKYNDKELKRIDITVQGDQNDVICVKDNGIGIEESYQKDVFEMFKKLHPKHEYDGAGLGLSICAKIADIYNYRIELESEVGVGSTFLLIPK
jgi:signal transduction histidine kinase